MVEQREPTEQFEHDLVIQAAVGQFAASAKYNTYANPGAEKTVGVSGKYPDIVVTEKGSGKVRFVIEVETASSVDVTEAAQWREFARLGPPLYLLVPQRVLPVAEGLCSKASIKCHCGYYYQDERGRFKIALQKE
jgi:hypothetical protein